MRAIQAWLARRRLERLRQRLRPSEPGLRRYLESYRAPAPETPVAEVSFVVVDTEATGLDPNRDEVVSLAAVRIDALALVPGDSLELTIARDRVGRDAARVHGLVVEDLSDGLTEREAIGTLFEFLASSVFVAHHARFDHTLLSTASARYGGPPILGPMLDTEQLARRVELGPLPGESSLRFSLDAVAERLGLETVARHTAGGDALLTAEILLRLLSRLGKNTPLDGLG